VRGFGRRRRGSLSSWRPGAAHLVADGKRWAPSGIGTTLVTPEVGRVDSGGARCALSRRCMERAMMVHQALMCSNNNGRGSGKDKVGLCISSKMSI